VVIAHQDITDQRRAQHQLDLYDRALSAPSCSITLSDYTLPHLPLTYVNAAFLRITGYTEEEVLGRNVGGVLEGAEANPAALLDTVHQAERGGEAVVLQNAAHILKSNAATFDAALRTEHCETLENALRLHIPLDVPR